VIFSFGPNQAPRPSALVRDREHGARDIDRANLETIRLNWSADGSMQSPGIDTLQNHDASPLATRVYANQGNSFLLDLIEGGCTRLLDVGCGAGDNAGLIRAHLSNCRIFGITLSASEAQSARKHMDDCWVLDIESPLPNAIIDQRFDVILLSHVLEHLRHPASVVARLSNLLRNGGQMLIAVPNILSWKMRLRFLRGDFAYQSSGVLDDTHLHFYTHFTADRYLLAESPQLRLVTKTVSGNLPLWRMRKSLMPQSWAENMDRWACRTWPNLIGNQVLLNIRKQ
jgi:2-polyprenyl-3-methyl-5-hydroxy-6-metoxy-1,4-benzoquinol methylase